MKLKVLLVTADETLESSIGAALEESGYAVFRAADRYRAIHLMNEHDPDFIILDTKIPDSDVVLLCRTFRWEMKLPATSVLLLTHDPNHNLRFMDIRVDDYLEVPFEMEDLLFKLESLERRLENGRTRSVLKAGDIEMLREQWKVYVDGGPVNLTEKEYRLLQELMEANGRVLTREALLERIWGHEQSVNIESRTLDVHMSRLRRKLGRSARNIITVRNVGYRMSVYPE